MFFEESVPLEGYPFHSNDTVKGFNTQSTKAWDKDCFHCAQWHYLFRQDYFSDLSFLLTSLVFKVHDAGSLKIYFVSDIVKKGKEED